jgi:hypothetical protein
MSGIIITDQEIYISIKISQERRAIPLYGKKIHSSQLFREKKKKKTVDPLNFK